MPRETKEKVENPWIETITGARGNFLMLLDAQWRELPKEPGEAYGLEQELDDPDKWQTVFTQEHELITAALENVLGVKLSNPTRHESQAGVDGEISEGNVKVDIYLLRNSLELHRMSYENTSIPFFNLVYAGNEQR